MEQYKSTHTGEQIDSAVDKVINNDLPIASSTSLGAVKVGENLSITSDGVLSASGGSSGGGTKLYKHTLSCSAKMYMTSKPCDLTGNTTAVTFTLVIINNSATKIEYIGSYLDDKLPNLISVYCTTNSVDSWHNVLYYGLVFMTNDEDEGIQSTIGFWSNYKSLYCQCWAGDVTVISDTVTEL